MAAGMTRGAAEAADARAGTASTARPLVGVTGSDRGGRIMWACNRLALWRAGARAVRITPGRPFPAERLDAVVVGGGDDIEPSLYGLEVTPAVRIDPERDRMELRMLDCTRARGIPVLGICRGSQIINVHQGGTLHRDIYEAYGNAPKLRTVLPRKRVRIEAQSRLRELLCGQETCMVNALHHQSVDRLGSGLVVAALDQVGIVQAVEGTGPGFLIGVQWHPEFLVADSCQQNLFRSLVAAAVGERLAVSA
ncbi:gamma-glutamyl-gamma-aminobutyrate hydrolase family protein [Arenibaculum pallidiluteum]|uniref:gamma-glutamyl-gamma-aminobutyrate hydrolase family protein n=1 Tax=Arenibaculum pallidiluteum TaxID=2812559 RepID=UPI001F36A87F|nr:type 1 glutamine amidotransferase [Arenibaculum pallidiluteum]